MILRPLETFIEQKFKYPKGGGWDLASLWEDLLFQNDVHTLSNNSNLSRAIAEKHGFDYQETAPLDLIAKELITQYRPLLQTEQDQVLFAQLCRHFEVRDTIRNR